MENRVFTRISSQINVHFQCCETNYSGTIINLSENGMFIVIKKLFFPFDMQFKIAVPLKRETLLIPVEIRRIIISPDSYDGIAVRLTNPSRNYIKLIDNLRNSLYSIIH
jgi:hypothetical protein